MPLRIRLPIAYAVLVTAVEVGLVALVAWTRRDAQAASFDARLLSIAHDASQRLVEDARLRAADIARDTIQRSRELLYVEVDDAKGRRLGASSISLGSRIPFARTAALPDRVQFADVGVTSTDLGTEADAVVRHVALPFLDEDGDAHVLHAVARTTGGRQATRDLAAALRWVAPLSFLAAAVCAWLLERRALRPLHDMAQAAALVRPDTLRRGLEIDHAEGEVAHLRDALNRALQKIDEAFEEQSRFAANVSHEMRTPVAVLLAQAQVLDPSTATTEEVAEFRATVEAEMRRLGRTVESFLLLARYGPDAAMENARPVPVLDVVLEAVRHGKGHAARYGVALVPRFELSDEAPPPVVRGDASLLRTLLDNLISNAVRFSPHGASVDVCVATAEGEVRLTVRDRGPGIPAGYAEKLFDRRAQTPVDAPRRGGFGLGLSIVATVVRLHHGQVVARNLPERGCEFVVTLPLVGEAAPAEPEPPAASPAPSPERAGPGRELPGAEAERRQEA